MFRRHFLAFLAALAFVPAVRAMTVLPLSLDDIAATAAIAFEGRCLETRSALDPVTNLPVTYTTFSVQEVLKGDVGATYTIKQVGSDVAHDGKHFKVHGVPTFAVGEDYVVFLAGVSRSGFSSPIGLSQGRFVVQPGTGGAEVTNGRDFREMASDIPEAELPPGLAQRIKHADKPVPHVGLQEFKQLMRERGARSRR